MKHAQVFPAPLKEKPHKLLDPMKWVHQMYRKAIWDGGIKLFYGGRIGRDGDQDVTSMEMVILTDVEVKACPEQKLDDLAAIYAVVHLVAFNKALQFGHNIRTLMPNEFFERS